MEFLSRKNKESGGEHDADWCKKQYSASGQNGESIIKTNMQQAPLFRIEDVMNGCDITHSTAAKLVNTFIALKIVKQADSKQRYRVYEYAPLMGCIRKI